MLLHGGRLGVTHGRVELVHGQLRIFGRHVSSVDESALIDLVVVLDGDLNLVVT